MFDQLIQLEFINYFQMFNMNTMMITAQDNLEGKKLIETEPIACEISMKTSNLDTAFPAKIILSTLPSKHEEGGKSDLFSASLDVSGEIFQEDDDDDDHNLLIVDEKFSVAELELINNNIAED